jgi:hypothetical protein
VPLANVSRTASTQHAVDVSVIPRVVGDDDRNSCPTLVGSQEEAATYATVLAPSTLVVQCCRCSPIEENLRQALRNLLDR